MNEPPPRLPLPLPPQVPQLRQSTGRRFIAGCIRLAGWRFEGTIPDLPRLVVIVAPHSSWWDGLLGMAFKVALGLDVAFIGKQELFHGPLGWLLRHLGGMPVARGHAHGLVEQVAGHFAERPRMWFGLAPEGTRHATKAWKSGFWRIARAAEVPILPVAFDYPSRRVVLGEPFMPTTELEDDLERLRGFYAPMRGLRRGVSGL